MSATDLFRRITGELDAAGIPYMLTGSFASSYHGIPRATQDLDLVIAPTAEQLRALLPRFPTPAYYVDEGAALEALHHASQFNILDLDSGWKIDLIIRKDRPFSLVEFSRREQTEVEGVPLMIATVEDVILAKLEWAKLGESDRQVEDVATLLRVRHADLDRPYLNRWLAELQVEREWREACTRAGIQPEGER